MAHLSPTEALSGAIAQAADLGAEMPRHEEARGGSRGGKGDGLSEAMKKLDTCAREHPWKTVGIALGVGLLIGVTR